MCEENGAAENADKITRKAETRRKGPEEPILPHEECSACARSRDERFGIVAHPWHECQRLAGALILLRLVRYFHVICRKASPRLEASK